MSKQAPEKVKTRPDLGDELWLAWIAALPENRGLMVRELYRTMLEWCHKKGVTPTRRRLLKWLDNTREEVPLTYEPAYFDKPAADAATDPEPEPTTPNCSVCKNERFVKQIIDPTAEFEWLREGMVPCTACSQKEK